MTSNHHHSTIFSTISKIGISDEEVFIAKEKTHAEFCVHPLVAMEHFIKDRNVNNISDYPRFELFSETLFGMDNEPSYPINMHLTRIKDVDIPNYDELRDHVMGAVEHFRLELAMAKLQDAYISDWLATVGIAISDMDHRKLFPDHLSAVCKLVPFYEFEQEICKLSNLCDNLKDTGMVSKTFKNLRLLAILTPQTRHDKGKKAYFFRTTSGHLLRVDFDPVMSSAVDTILRLRQTISLDILAKSRIMYSSNFTYLVANKINSIGS
jgi:hypothetical protein